MARLAPSVVSVVSAVLALGLLACGDDGGQPTAAPQPTRPTANAQSAAAAAAAAIKNPLVEKPHVEDRVQCPVPDQPTDPKDGKCDPKVPSCGERLYCLTLAQGSFCEPCPERDGIRHAFRDRDFDGEFNRDPFQSQQAILDPRDGGKGQVFTKECRRSDQLVASNYSYADLKLVGIVAQGTQRKVLMMGGPLGYIIKRGDCVGKEKAVVKDIGLGYVTFQAEPEDYSVQLNPKQLSVSEPESPANLPRTTIAPVVAPPAVIPPRAEAGSGPPGAPAPAPGVAPAAPPSARPAGAAAAGVPPAAPPAAPRVPVVLQPSTKPQ